MKLIYLKFLSLILVLSLCSAARAQLADSLTIIAGQADTTAADSLIEIGDVIVTGFKKTKPYIIEREIPFKKGNHILQSELADKLKLCRQQVMNTSLFVDVEVAVIARQANLIFIEVHVKERWYLFPLPYFDLVDRNLNQWWVEHKRSLDRINYGVKFTQHNFSGRNDKLNILFISGYTQQASIRYDNPFFDNKLKHGFGIGLSYSRNRELTYTTSLNKQLFFKHDNQFVIKQVHADLSYSYRPAIKTRHNFRVAFTETEISDTVVKLNTAYFGEGRTKIRFPDLAYSLVYFNVDYIPYPLKGFMGDFSVYKRLGRSTNLWQFSGKATYSFPLLPKTFLQFQASASLKLPFKQPYYNLRLFGSSDLYMRGLEYYVIDGVAGGVVRGTAKQQLLSFKLHNPLGTRTHDKIPFRLLFKTYGDLGYAYAPKPGNSVLNNKLLSTYGVGIDILTFYDIVVKLEYSFNQLGDRGFFVHSKDDF